MTYLHSLRPEGSVVGDPHYHKSSVLLADILLADEKQKQREPVERTVGAEPPAVCGHPGECYSWHKYCTTKDGCLWLAARSQCVSVSLGANVTGWNDLTNSILDLGMVAA